MRDAIKKLLIAIFVIYVVGIIGFLLSIFLINVL